MDKAVDDAKARIRHYKSGRTRQAVWGRHASYEDTYVADCKLVADWYACHADHVDAERYRWLRSRHHSDSPLCVVSNPQESVKPGKDCPSLDRLDDMIDEAMGKLSPDPSSQGPELG